MKKKIIFVTKALWVGGIETALVNLLNYLDYNKYDVTLLMIHAVLDMRSQIHPKCRVLIVDRDETHSFREKYQFSWLYHLTEKTDNPSRLHRALEWTVPIMKWIENRLYIRYIRKLMEDEYFDTAVIYSDVVAEMTIRAIHAEKYLMFYHHGAMRHVYHDKIAYKKCKKIIAVSRNQANELKKFAPESAEKIIVINNLINVDEICQKANQPIEEVFDKTKFNIVSVGRIMFEKGTDRIIPICSKLVESGYRNICWWIIGEGPEMDKVSKLVDKNKMRPYINLVGLKKNPYPYMKQADLYVQPSRVESFGLTILEALVLGKIIVATETFGAKEILGKEKTMLCGNNIDEITEAVKNNIDFSKATLNSNKNNKQKIKRKNKLLMIDLEKVL